MGAVTPGETLVPYTTFVSVLVKQSNTVAHPLAPLALRVGSVQVLADASACRDRRVTRNLNLLSPKYADHSVASVLCAHLVGLFEEGHGTPNDITFLSGAQLLHLLFLQCRVIKRRLRG